MSNKDSSGELIFVGYTNGDQILYANEGAEGSGLFFSNSDGNCYVPLYILKTHAHRIRSTSIKGFSSEKLKEMRAKS